MSSVDNQKLGNLYNSLSEDYEGKLTNDEIKKDLEKIEKWSCFEAVATLYKWDQTKPSKPETVKEREDERNQEKTGSELIEPTENWTRIYYETGKKH